MLPFRLRAISTILLFMVSHLFVQGQLTGKISDTHDQSPLEYATAALYQQQDSILVTGVITNNQGIFEIENIGPGDYYLEASFMGYQYKTYSPYSNRKERTKKRFRRDPIVFWWGPIG